MGEHKSDLGYFKIDTFANINQDQRYFLSKCKFGVTLQDAKGG